MLFTRRWRGPRNYVMTVKYIFSSDCIYLFFLRFSVCSYMLTLYSSSRASFSCSNESTSLTETFRSDQEIYLYGNTVSDFYRLADRAFWTRALLFFTSPSPILSSTTSWPLPPHPLRTRPWLIHYFSKATCPPSPPSAGPHFQHGLWIVGLVRWGISPLCHFHSHWPD